MVSVFCYVYEGKSHFLIRQSISCHCILLKMWYLFVCQSLDLTYDIYFSSSSRTNLAISICFLVFHVFIFRVYLTLVKAVTLILKHATFLQTSMSPKSALATVEKKYRKANVDVTIQQHLTACAAEQSEEQFVSFIMSTDIGLFIFLPFVTSLSYYSVSVISVLSSYRCIEHH
jgi:hypothetical protein